MATTCTTNNLFQTLINQHNRDTSITALVFMNKNYDQKRHGWFQNKGLLKVNGVKTSNPWVCEYCHLRVFSASVPGLRGCRGAGHPIDSPVPVRRVLTQWKE